jgi:hypothetical protein
MERPEFDLLFRWFDGLGIDEAVSDHSTFPKNRNRLPEQNIAAKLLAAVAYNFRLLPRRLEAILRVFIPVQASRSIPASK